MIKVGILKAILRVEIMADIGSICLNPDATGFADTYLTKFQVLDNSSSGFLFPDKRLDDVVENFGCSTEHFQIYIKILDTLVCIH